MLSIWKRSSTKHRAPEFRLCDGNFYVFYCINNQIYVWVHTGILFYKIQRNHSWYIFWSCMNKIQILINSITASIMEYIHHWIKKPFPLFKQNTLNSRQCQQTLLSHWFLRSRCIMSYMLVMFHFLFWTLWTHVNSPTMQNKKSVQI